MDRFVNELFDGVLGSLDLRFFSDYVIRKKHLSKVFKDLLQLKTLSPDRKETILNKLIKALPKYPHKVACLEARKKMIEILREELPDIIRDLERLSKFIDLQEVEQSLKIDLIKQKGYITSLREAINEIILTEELPPEVIQKYLLLDQALSLLVSLYEKAIASGGLIGFEKYGHYILILLLRIYSILKNQEDIKNLEEDIIKIAPLVSKTGDMKTLKLAALEYDPSIKYDYQTKKITHKYPLGRFFYSKPFHKEFATGMLISLLASTNAAQEIPKYSKYYIEVETSLDDILITLYLT